LAERFSQIDYKIARDQLKQAEKNREKILPEVEKIIKQKDLPQKVSALFFSYSKFNANCHLRA